MTAEQVRIPITRFRDEAGQPTCAFNFDTKQVCTNLRTQRWGLEDVCALETRTCVRRAVPLNRRLDADGETRGTLIPTHDCPVWAEGAAA